MPDADKDHHIRAFAISLSFSRPRLAPWIVLAAVAHGGAIELIQPFVGRGRELLDFVADTVRAVSGGLLGIGLDRFRKRLG